MGFETQVYEKNKKDVSMKHSVWIYDIETLKNLFTYTAKNRDTGEIFVEYIWDIQDDRFDRLERLKTHLRGCTGGVGYNNLRFDYPVLHCLLTENLGNSPANRLYKKAQSVIDAKWPEIKTPLINQLDLFRLWHFDNAAKMTSLKKLQITLGWESVEDMPYEHTREIKTQLELDQILSYNLNDVLSTEAFFKVSEGKINLRRELFMQYGLDCFNYSDSKIGEQLMLKLYCESTGRSQDKVKKLRTHRKSFKFSECIPDYVCFSTDEFNGLLEYLRGIEVEELKDSFKYSFDYKGFTYDLGTGGIHGCIEGGVYESDEDYIIVDADVSSLYPSIAIANNYYPEHLGERFAEIYRDGIVIPRLEAKKSGDKVMADGFKLAANSVYGKSNSEYSWLYDPLYTLKTTITGQLSLCMLSEMIVESVGDLTMLQLNTDGLSVRIPRKHKRLLWETCKKWEQITGLNLEYVAYDKMVIRDVNNYMAVTVDGKIKRKGGAFRLNSDIIADEEYHKPLNQGVVQEAVNDYFLRGVEVEYTIAKCKDILMFAKTFSATHGWSCELFSEELTIPQQKTNRYVVTLDGMGFRKCKDVRQIEIEAGRKVTIINQLPRELPKLDYQYYIEEAYKIIHRVDGTEKKMLEDVRQQREKEKMRREEDNFLTYCIRKVPTNRQLLMYQRPWLIEKYGRPETKN